MLCFYKYKTGFVNRGWWRNLRMVRVKSRVVVELEGDEGEIEGVEGI